MPEGRPSPTRSDPFASALAVLVTAAVFRPFALLGVDAHHDGIVLKPALDVLAGQRIFRDTFSQYGVGLPYLQAALLGIFGPTLAVMRLTTVGLYALAAGIFVSAWRLVLPRGLALLALGVWLLLPGFYGPSFGPQAWSSVYALVFQAVAMRSLMRALLDVRPLRNGVVSGVACTLVFACRQPVGAATSAAVLCAYALAPLMTGNRRAVWRAAIGCFAAMVASYGLLFAGLATAGLLPDWYFQTVVWPRRWAVGEPGSLWSGIVQHMLPMPEVTIVPLLLGATAVVLLPWVPPSTATSRRCAALAALALLLAAATWRFAAIPTLQMIPTLWVSTTIPLTILAFVASAVGGSLLRRRPADDGEAAAVGAGLIGLASWPQYFPQLCPMHQFWALTPGIGIGIYAVWCATKRRSAATAVLTAALLLPLAYTQARLAHDKLTRPYTRLTGLPVLEGMQVPTLDYTADAAHWQGMIAALRLQLLVRPGAPMLIEGRDALVATLVPNRRNPGPFFVDWSEMGLDLGAVRARFIADERPLVLQQRPPAPAVAQALALFRYHPVYDSRLGTLLAPGSDTAPARRAER